MLRLEDTETIEVADVRTYTKKINSNMLGVTFHFQFWIKEQQSGGTLDARRGYSIEIPT